MHDGIYPGHRLERMAKTLDAPIRHFMSIVLSHVKRLLEDTNNSPKNTIRILDYGCGTGLAIIELLKMMQADSLFDVINDRKINFEIYGLDIPTSWFAQAHHLLNQIDCVKFYSCYDTEKKSFIPLEAIFPKASVDIVISSMVFHLISEKAFSKLSKNIGHILAHDGVLVWNSPDMLCKTCVGFPMHDPYRELRRHVTELLCQPGKLAQLIEKAHLTPDYMIQHVRDYLSGYSVDEEHLKTANAVADAYIRPEAKVIHPDFVHQTLQGEASLHGEFTERDFASEANHIRTIISIPSNQNYINQLPPGVLRTSLIHLVLNELVIPQLLQRYPDDNQPMSWVFGNYRKGAS